MSFPAVIDVNTMLVGSNGFNLTSTIVDFGWSVVSAGDMNGDGIADLVVGNSYDAAYVVFGSRNGFAATLNVDSPGLNGSNGFKLINAIANSYFGISVASAGDVNGDGVADLVVGAASYHPAATYVVFGSTSGFNATFNVDSPGLNGRNGFMLTSTGSGFGTPVASAGDLNGDGLADVMVSARGTSAVYVVFGQASTITSLPSVIEIVVTGAATSDDVDSLNS